jgi:hypothetical protein
LTGLPVATEAEAQAAAQKLLAMGAKVTALSTALSRSLQRLFNGSLTAL